MNATRGNPVPGCHASRSGEAGCASAEGSCICRPVKHSHGRHGRGTPARVTRSDACATAVSAVRAPRTMFIRSTGAGGSEPGSLTPRRKAREENHEGSKDAKADTQQVGWAVPTNERLLWSFTSVVCIAHSTGLQRLSLPEIPDHFVRVSGRRLPAAIPGRPLLEFVQKGLAAQTVGGLRFRRDEVVTQRQGDEHLIVFRQGQRLLQHELSRRAVDPYGRLGTSGTNGTRFYPLDSTIGERPAVIASNSDPAPGS
jgi:hypothetical protein